MLKVDVMNKKQSKGFSLVELLVAMVVGLVIISGAFSLHSTTRKTQMANEAQLDMAADARFAIEMIAYDLRHSCRVLQHRPDSGQLQKREDQLKPPPPGSPRRRVELIPTRRVSVGRDVLRWHLAQASGYHKNSQPLR